MRNFLRGLSKSYFAKNHPVTYNYVDKFPEGVKNEIKNFREKPMHIPKVIRGVKNYDVIVKEQICPYDYSVVCDYSVSNMKDLRDAVEASERGRKIWSDISEQEKCDIFLRAADLVCGEYRNKLLAATVFGQGKNIYQAEIDAICELADFLRFNVQYYGELNGQSLISQKGERNEMGWRGLGGFVGAISPFNFTAIGGNLMSAPLLMGNPVLWKPSDSSILSNYLFYEIMCEAGMPPEAVQFVPAMPEDFMEVVTNAKNMSGLVFTGSSEVFDNILMKVYKNVSLYDSYPRVVGETGGNNYHFIFPDMKDDIDEVVDKTIRGAFEYAGQKCSATSRVYVPRSMYIPFMDRLSSKMDKMKVGSPEEDYNFMSAVIHERSFNICRDWIKENNENIIYGGITDKREGYYVSPTVIQYDTIDDDRWRKEIFGPILSLYVYDDGNDNSIRNALSVCSIITPYRLTGAVFYRDEKWRDVITEVGKNVGNFYVNDKSTGSVVGNQPFGGFGKSGTNDKAGAKYFLVRFGNMIVHKIVS